MRARATQDPETGPAIRLMRLAAFTIHHLNRFKSRERKHREHTFLKVAV